jgi:hypothetical protein
MSYTYYKDNEGDLWRLDSDNNFDIYEFTCGNLYWNNMDTEQATEDIEFIKDRYEAVEITEEECFIELV